MKTKSVKMAAVDELMFKILSRKAEIGIIGLGYVGLPLAIAQAEAGFKVTGYEISKEKIKLLNAGKSDIDDIPDKLVKAAVEAGKLRATEKGKLVPVVMCTVRSAVGTVGEGLSAGVTDYVVKPFEMEELLERVEKALEKSRGQ